MEREDSLNQQEAEKHLFLRDFIKIKNFSDFKIITDLDFIGQKIEVKEQAKTDLCGTLMEAQEGVF